MLSVVERMSLLDEADALAKERDFGRLDTLLQSIDPFVVESDPLLRYYRILAKLQTGNVAEAIELSEYDAPYFERHQDSRVYRRYLNVVGILMTHSGRVEDASNYFSRVLGLATAWEDRQLAADATMNLGVIADIQGRWADALVSHMRALTNFLELSDRPMVAGCYHNMAMTFRQLGMLSESQSRFETALEIWEISGSRTDTAATALEKSLLYLRMGEHELAEAVSKTAFVEIKSSGNIRLFGEALRVIGMIRLHLGNAPSAMRFLRRAYARALKGGNVLLQAEAAEAMSRGYLQLGLEEESKRLNGIATTIYGQIGSTWRLGQLGTSDGGIGTARGPG